MPQSGRSPSLPERLAVTDDHEPTFTALSPDRSSRPRQLFTWPSDRANYVAAAKIKKTQEKWINAYCLRLFASVSYFTHARSARLYGLTNSIAARGRMPDKYFQRTGPLRPAERRCTRGDAGPLSGGDFTEDGRGGDMDYPCNLGSYTRKVTATSGMPTNANCTDLRHASQSR